MSDCQDVTLYIELLVGLAASTRLESASAAVVAMEFAAEAEKLERWQRRQRRCMRSCWRRRGRLVLFSMSLLV
jgi:hypothetical protein